MFKPLPKPSNPTRLSYITSPKRAPRTEPASNSRLGELHLLGRVHISAKTSKLSPELRSNPQQNILCIVA